MLHSDWPTAFPPTPQEPDFFQARNLYSNIANNTNFQ